MLTIGLIIAALAAPANLSAGPEEAAVRTALQHYLDGQAGGGPEAFARAFYPEARLQVVRDGKLTLIESQQWIANMKPAAPGAKLEPKPGNRIEWIDVSGSAAVAKIRLESPRGAFSDYMTLMKVDGSWRIANKAFHFFPKDAVAK